MNEITIETASKNHPFATHKLRIKETLSFFAETIKNKHKTNHISDYQKLNPTEKISIVSALMSEYMEFDPHYIFEKDGHDDHFLMAIIRVIKTEGIDDKANAALVNSLMSVYVYGTEKRPPAFAIEVTEALIRELEI